MPFVASQSTGGHVDMGLCGLEGFHGLLLLRVGGFGALGKARGKFGVEFGGAFGQAPRGFFEIV